MNKRKLYESIMRNVAKQVKKALNEEERINNEDNSEFVDLSLPSGTLWMKHNLGATCEETPESWYGDYYMWGSTTPNTNIEYSWETAPFNNGSDDFDKKYFNSIKKQVCPNGQLSLDYDAAYQATDGMACMPTKEQFEELKQYTDDEWIIDYNGIKDLNGRIFTGKNGNTLFIPASGCGDGLRCWGQGCKYNSWSSNLWKANPFLASGLYFDKNDIYIGNAERWFGFTIRPVCF